VPPQTRLPRDLWRFEVDLGNVADLTVEGVLEAHRIRALAPTRRQWPKTQPIGEHYFREGFPAILVPSAAHEGGRVLVVFRTEPGPIYGLKPIKPPKTFKELPALPTGLRT
jgi:hypothetical protein